MADPPVSDLDFKRPKRCPRQRTGREDRRSKFYEISDNLNTCSLGTTHPKYLVFPGQHAVTSQVETVGHVINLFVPKADVGNPPRGARLYSVTAHTVSQAGPAGPFDCSVRDPNGNNQDPSGQIFNVYDKSPAYTTVVQ